jgi:hypothetical protein
MPAHLSSFCLLLWLNKFFEFNEMNISQAHEKCICKLHKLNIKEKPFTREKKLGFESIAFFFTKKKSCKNSIDFFLYLK